MIIKTSFIVVHRRTIAAALLLSLFAGCGSSVSDPMERAKMRRRSAPSAAEVNPATETKGGTETAESDDPEPRGQMPDVDVVSTKSPTLETTAVVAPTAEPTETESVTILPIAERHPEQPLTEGQRRERSADNIKKVAAAVIAYANQTGEFPKPGAIKSEGGIETLSWRVAILPYLGYPDLYKKFDPNEPWDGEHNRKLLDQIPDEYVSPERFDTKTNYLGPAFRSFMFGVDRIGPNGIEDGAANTILLVEVDESYAVEWTRPADYDVPALEMKRGLGTLRGDGAIAVWANGMPTLLPNNASEQQLMNAFTHESSDGQNAAVLHRPVTVEVVATTAMASNDSPVTQLDTPLVRPQSQLPDTDPTLAVVRLPIPNASNLSEAANKLRTVFAKRLGQASTEAERTAIAKEMLLQAVEMNEDPAGAYSLLSAASMLSIQAGEFATAIEAMETKIRQFEVDAYEENAATLIAFGKANSGRRAGKIAADEYVRRAIRVIHAGIGVDDFARTSTIARYALMFKGENEHDETVVMLNRLRTQLSVARGHYTRTGLALATLRADPQNRQAAEEVGRFLCFVKGDWNTGLPLLAKSEHAALSELATADLAGNQDSSGMLAVADRWWELSDRTTQGVFRQACRDRAVMWYEAAIEHLPESLDKLHAKARLDEAGDSKATSPLALVKRLADESNVDLSASLTGVYRDRNRTTLSRSW